MTTDFTKEDIYNELKKILTEDLEIAEDKIMIGLVPMRAHGKRIVQFLKIPLPAVRKRTVRQRIANAL